MKRKDLFVASRERPMFSDMFRDAVSSAMREVLSDTGARAVLYHVGPVDSDDVQGFHVKLKTTFGSGAPSLEKVIVSHIALLLHVPISTLRSDDMVKSASLARASMKRSRRR